MAKGAAFRFENEAAMCAAFIRDAARQGWDAYPETANFDIVLVHRKSGLQVAVEANQQFNLHVLLQASEDPFWTHGSGPDFRAVLVPEGGPVGLGSLAGRLGVTVIRARGEPNRKGLIAGRGPYLAMAFDPQLPDPKFEDHDGYWWERSDCRGWFQQPYAEPLKLPEYIPDVAAGSPSPIRLTQWKVRAIKIDVLIERRGFVTKGDFTALEISMSRWTQSGWIDGHPTLRGAYVRGRYRRDFRAQHPVNYDQIAADFDTWSKALPATIAQPSLIEAVRND